MPVAHFAALLAPCATPTLPAVKWSPAGQQLKQHTADTPDVRLVAKVALLTGCEGAKSFWAHVACSTPHLPSIACNDTQNWLYV